MKVGIDSGATLMKFAWMENEVLRFASCEPEDDHSLVCVVEGLLRAGITHGRKTGIGKLINPYSPCIVGPSGDPIQDEIQMQARGVQKLLEMQGASLETFQLVSIGTGVSYTLVNPRQATRFPIGSAIGGGYIAGIASLIGVGISEVGLLAEQGTPMDLFVRDLVPQLADQPQGNLIVAHFGKSDDSSKANACASLLSMVAVGVARDLMLINMLPKDVVIIGTPVAHFAPLREMLRAYLTFADLNAHFLENGQYAAAIGALYSE